MQKEQWINEVLQSTNGMQKAEPGPFLFEKIVQRITKEKEATSPDGNALKVRWALGIAASLLIAVNVVSIKTYISASQNNQTSDQANTANAYNNSTIYSY